jgi:hypothetical protein
MDVTPKTQEECMKRTRVLLCAGAVVIAVNFGLLGSIFAATHSGQAIKESVQASGHASAAAGHAIGASGQVTSAAVAVPVAASGVADGSVAAGAMAVGASAGVAGSAATSTAAGLVKSATAPIGTPLEVSDETVTVGPPPDKALKPATPVQ